MHVELRVPAGARARWDEATLPAIERSRGEPGSVRYHYAADLGDPELIHAIEVWDSTDALERHMALHADRVALNAELGVTVVAVHRFVDLDAG